MFNSIDVSGESLIKIKLGGFLMSLKQKVGMGVVTASLGLSYIRRRIRLFQ